MRTRRFEGSTSRMGRNRAAAPAPPAPGRAWLDVQREMMERNTDVPPDRRIEFRMGIRPSAAGSSLRPSVTSRKQQNAAQTRAGP
jgi:hypothetical protein